MREEGEGGEGGEGGKGGREGARGRVRVEGRERGREGGREGGKEEGGREDEIPLTGDSPVSTRSGWVCCSRQSTKLL